MTFLIRIQPLKMCENIFLLLVIRFTILMWRMRNTVFLLEMSAQNENGLTFYRCLS